MKKLASLMLAFIVVLTSVLPAFATDYNSHDLADISTVWESEDYPFAAILDFNNGNEQQYQLFTTTTPLLFSGLSPTLSGGAFKRYVYEPSTSKWSFVGGSSTSYSKFSSSYSLVWASYSTHCNGSGCSAFDANFNGLCDECGFSLMNLTRSPSYPVVDGNNKNYVAFYSGTLYKYTAYTYDESYTIRGEEYGARYRTYTDPSVNVKRFESYDGINWQETYSGKTANDYPGEIGTDELIASSFDWYTEAGDRFFPVPLWEEILQVTQGEIPELEAETGGTMKTLVLSGVGLMALLMALTLFGKRWLLFLR